MQDELRDAVLLVFANKQDLPNAMNAAEITGQAGPALAAPAPLVRPRGGLGQSCSLLPVC